MSTRVVGFDLARALAVFGMVLVNFKVVMAAPDAGPLWLARALALLEGRAAATFVVLAGIGIAMLSRTARETGDAALLARAQTTLLKRALFLFIVGLLFAPVWPGRHPPLLRHIHRRCSLPSDGVQPPAVVLGRQRGDRLRGTGLGLRL